MQNFFAKIMMILLIYFKTLWLTLLKVYIFFPRFFFFLHRLEPHSTLLKRSTLVALLVLFLTLKGVLCAFALVFWLISFIRLMMLPPGLIVLRGFGFVSVFCLLFCLCFFFCKPWVSIRSTAFSLSLQKSFSLLREFFSPNVLMVLSFRIFNWACMHAVHLAGMQEDGDCHY